MPQTHYGIVGPGALGLLWAARLSLAHTVSLWGRRGSLSLSYDLVSTRQDTQHVELETHRDQVPEVVLLTTKSHDALPAVRQAVEHWGCQPEAIVMFQNGIGSQEAIAAAYPRLPVFAAATTEGANRRDNDSVIHAGQGLTRLGALTAPGTEPVPGSSERGRSLVADFIAAGFPSRQEQDIHAALWQKLLVNAGINPFTVLLGKPNGALLGDSLFESTIGQLTHELARVSRTQGYAETPEAIETRIRNVAQATAGNISSMLQDARAGRRTEIDDINGAIAAIGRKHGLATPKNDMLWQAVREKTTHR